MNESLKQQLTESWEDEKADIIKYMNLADECEKAGWCETAGIIRDIAHDETTHAKALHDVLSEDKKW